VKIVTSAIAVYCGVVLLGEIFTFERYPSGNFDPNPERIVAKSSISKGGNPLGSVIDYFERKISVSFKKLTPSWIKNTFIPVWENHLRQLKPFAWAWDITNHSDEVYYLMLAVNARLSMPYDPVRRSLSLNLKGIVEE
jgi:hypothetical protein